MLCENFEVFNVVGDKVMYKSIQSPPKLAWPINIPDKYFVKRDREERREGGGERKREKGETASMRMEKRERFWWELWWKQARPRLLLAVVFSLKDVAVLLTFFFFPFSNNACGILPVVCLWKNLLKQKYYIENVSRNKVKSEYNLQHIKDLPAKHTHKRT